MIRTITLTIVIEGALVVAYAAWRKKPAKHLLVSSIVINIITQLLLWTALIIFPRHYFPTLLIAEAGILLIEGFLFHIYRKNQLNSVEALLLSFIINLASFSTGLFLPF